MTKQSSFSSVEHTLHLLEFLRDQPQGVEVFTLLTHLDIPRSSLFVLLNTLKSLGYIEQTERRGRYRPGPRLLAWQGGSTRLAADLLLSFFQEAEACGLDETLALFVRSGESEALLLGQVESKREVRSVFRTGERMLASSAAAQTLQPLVPPDLQAQGYALSKRGDALDVALPICRDGHTPDAALVMSLPAFRWNEEVRISVLPRLREMAARLSYRLGALRYSPWQPETIEIGEMLPLDEQQIASLLKAPWTAQLACVRPDGAPHVVSVWHEWDGKVFHVVVWKGARWGEYLLANPQVSLTVDEPFLPLRRVLVKGTAQPAYEADDPRLTRLLLRLRRRYLGPNLAAALIPPVERSFIIVPSLLKGWQGIVG